MILAADIGGTKILFGLFEVKEGSLTLLFQSRYPSRQFSSVEEATAQFLKEQGISEQTDKITSACFSVAGPVINGTCHLTNLGWLVEQQSLQKKFPNIERILLRNDMEAMAKGLSRLEAKDVVSLTPKLPIPSTYASQHARPTSNQNANQNAVIGLLVPGTGLGEAFIHGDEVFSSEGAHCEFGPRSREEVALWEFLHQQKGHVSYEQILSGKGLCRLAEFLTLERGLSKPEEPLTPEEITRRANLGDCDVCTATVEMFTGIWGAEAGNLALKTMAIGGIYLGGNMICDLLPWLSGGFFLGGFLDKGRFSSLMETIPVFAILNENTALFGSALMAVAEPK